jgi:hypothetical protein
VSDQEFASVLPQLQAAHGIIFDLRGYPSRIGWGWIGHVIGATVK